MTREQWHNLSHAYRWQRRYSGWEVAVRWIAFLNPHDFECIAQTIL